VSHPDGPARRDRRGYRVVVLRSRVLHDGTLPFGRRRLHGYLAEDPVIKNLT
jgi:hypothetical protein